MRCNSVPAGALASVVCDVDMRVPRASSLTTMGTIGTNGGGVGDTTANAGAADGDDNRVADDDGVAFLMVLVVNGCDGGGDGGGGGQSNAIGSRAPPAAGGSNENVQGKSGAMAASDCDTSVWVGQEDGWCGSP